MVSGDFVQMGGDSLGLEAESPYNIIFRNRKRENIKCYVQQLMKISAKIFEINLSVLVN